MQNLCGIPSLASTTAANHYFLYSTDCIHLFPSIPAFPRLRNPSSNPLQPLIIFSNTPQQTSHRRAFFNLPGCTITCPAACTSRNPSATVRVDLDVRGRLITLRLGLNSRVTNAIVYENRRRYPYPADGQRAHLPRPTNAAAGGRTLRSPAQVTEISHPLGLGSSSEDISASFPHPKS